MATPVLTGSQFRQALPDAQVRAIQIIHLALGAGILMFSAIAVVLHTIMEVAQPEPGSDGMLRNLTIASTVFFLVALPTSKLIYESFFRKKLDSQSPSGEMGVDEVMGKIRTAFIVRSAILEAAAFLGLIACLIAIFTGWLQQQPLYWVNLLPAAAFVAFTAATVPSRDRLERIFVDKILGRGC